MEHYLPENKGVQNTSEISAANSRLVYSSPDQAIPTSGEVKKNEIPRWWSWNLWICVRLFGDRLFSSRPEKRALSSFLQTTRAQCSNHPRFIPFYRYGVMHKLDVKCKYPLCAGRLLWPQTNHDPELKQWKLVFAPHKSCTILSVCLLIWNAIQVHFKVRWRTPFQPSNGSFYWCTQTALSYSRKAWDPALNIRKTFWRY